MPPLHRQRGLLAHRPKRRAAASVVLVAAWIFTGAFCVSARADSASAGEHIKGAVMVPVTLVVVDAQTEQPLTRAMVTYFTAREAQVLDEVAAGKHTVDADRAELPTGVVVHSTKQGEARLTCEFNAVFVETRQNSEARISRTQIFPEGRFVVKMPGYLPLSVQAQDLFPGVNNGTKAFGHSVTLRLHKAPDKA